MYEFLKDNMNKICIYVKDEDDVEYRVGYLIDEEYKEIEYLKLDNNENCDRMQIYKAYKDFYSLYDQLKNNDPLVLKYLNKLGYKKNTIDEIITYAYSCEHERGTWLIELIGVIGFDIEKEYEKANINKLSKESGIPIDIVREMIEQYNKFMLNPVYVKKTEVKGKKPEYSITWYYNIPKTFDTTVFDFRIKKENEIIDNSNEKYNKLIRVLIHDKNNHKDCCELFVDLKGKSKDECVLLINEIIKNTMELRFKDWYRPNESFLDFMRTLLSIRCFNDDQKDYIFITEDGDKKYPYHRLLRYGDMFETIEFEYDFDALVKEKIESNTKDEVVYIPNNKPLIEEKKYEDDYILVYFIDDNCQYKKLGKPITNKYPFFYVKKEDKNKCMEEIIKIIDSAFEQAVKLKGRKFNYDEPSFKALYFLKENQDIIADYRYREYGEMIKYYDTNQKLFEVLEIKYNSNKYYLNKNEYLSFHTLADYIYTNCDFYFMDGIIYVNGEKKEKFWFDEIFDLPDEYGSEYIVDRIDENNANRIKIYLIRRDKN